MHRRTTRLVAAAVLAVAVLGTATAADAKSNQHKPAALAVTNGTAVTVRVSRGTTTLTPAVTLPASVTVKVLAPARTGASTGSVRFPITQGRVNGTLGATATLTGATIGHVGGVSLTKGSTTVTIRNLAIQGSTVTAHLRVGHGRTSRVTLGTIGGTISSTLTSRSLVITGAALNLTAASAAALNAVLGTSFSAGTKLADISVDTKVVGKVHRR